GPKRTRHGHFSRQLSIVIRMAYRPAPDRLGRMPDLHSSLDAAELVPLVYDELRKLAAARMAREPDGHTLDGTALVHEVFLRLGGEKSFASKSGFLRAAAESMRRILVDHARAKRAGKRAGDRKRVE